MMIELQERYLPRPVRYLDQWQVDGVRLKIYGIAYRGEKPRADLIEAAHRLVRENLPKKLNGRNHYGVGFVGIHDGRGGNFVFFDFWADENELNHFVYISTADHPTALREVTATGPTACVWDLSLIGFERRAWIESVLANPNGPDLAMYLDQHMNEDV